MVKQIFKIVCVAFVIAGCGSSARIPRAGGTGGADSTAYNPTTGNGGNSANQDPTDPTNRGPASETSATLRLLKPTEIAVKAQSAFGKDWIVSVKADDGSTKQANGFEYYGPNLNGIDYDGNNEYSILTNAAYLSTHEQFCAEMSTASFADATTRAAFFNGMAETDTRASNPQGVKKALQAVTIKMLGRSFDESSPIFSEVQKLYGDLEAATPANRSNKSAMELTVRALCFSPEFVHNY